MPTIATTADYTIAFDQQRRLVVVRASGFWDRELQDRFAAQLIAELRRAADQGERFGVLADATNLPVQSLPISLGFMGIVRRLDRDVLVPTAVVTKSVLLRLQALRVFVAPHIRIFGDADAAHAWLADAIDR